MNDLVGIEMKFQHIEIAEWKKLVKGQNKVIIETRDKRVKFQKATRLYQDQKRRQKETTDYFKLPERLRAVE